MIAPLPSRIASIRWMPVALSSRCERDLVARARTAGGREPVQPDREDQLEDEAGEEHRGRVEEDREDAEDGVGPAIAEVGGEHAERDADDEGDDERVDRELERRGAVAEQHIGDELVVAEGAAEVAGEHLPEVLEVLHDEGPVVAGRVDALLQLVGGEPAAERGGDRVARRPHEEEDQGDQDEDGREDEQEPDEQIASERSAAAASSCERPGAWRRARGARRRSRSCDACLLREWGGPRERAAPPSSDAGYLVSGAYRNLNEASRTTPSMSVPETATWAPCRSGTVDSSSPMRAWMSSIFC